VSESGKEKTAWRYRLDRRIRSALMFIVSRIVPRNAPQPADLLSEKIEKIILVRAIFRLGDAILATTAILLFRQNFPAAQIDFVGASAAKPLFINLPINRFYGVYHNYLKASCSYLVLLREIRAQKYDLAVDVSGSSSAMGAFLVGFSGARLRAGLNGKWDRWFNLRYSRSRDQNKYQSMTHLIGALGLATGICYPQVMLSPDDLAAGRQRVAAILGESVGQVVGIFVGGRKARGKRWAKERFLKLAVSLHAGGARVIVFIGPDERALAAYFQGELGRRAAVVFEPDLRRFASLIASCHLFVACDSGPVHLACALRVRTVVIFLHNNSDRWGPPADLARIVCQDGGVSVDTVFDACCQELFRLAPIELGASRAS
jgi:heptosyltransferase-3